MFYVYEWFIKDTNEIIYVGKGTKLRYKVRKHNNLFNEMIKRFECESRIIKKFATEKEAFDFEFERINELKKQGQCICNIHRGGFGGTSEHWTEEKRKKYSINNCMKNQLQRKRMKINNPMKNKDVAQKVSEYNKIRVIINDVIYESVKEVCKKYNVSYSTVKKWSEKGINHLGEKCRYENQQQINFVGLRYNKGGCKQVIYKNKVYESVIDISKELNLNKHKVYKWVNKGFDDNGNPCRYVNDKRILIYKIHVMGEEKKKPIKVNGIIYNSKKEAEQALNIKPGGLGPYIKGIRKNKKYICEYVNQQPSHRNSK